MVTLEAEFIMGHSVDESGYTHYCYNYKDCARNMWRLRRCASIKATR